MEIFDDDDAAAFVFDLIEDLTEIASIGSADISRHAIYERVYTMLMRFRERASYGSQPERELADRWLAAHAFFAPDYDCHLRH